MCSSSLRREDDRGDATYEAVVQVALQSSKITASFLFSKEVVVQTAWLSM